MEQQIKSNEQLLDEFMLNSVKDMACIDISEIQKWVDKCKNNIKLSEPRYDGDDISAWTDECETWLWRKANNENIKFSTRDIGHFRYMLQDWLNDYYDKVA